MPDEFEKGDRIAYAYEYGDKKELVLHGGTVLRNHPQLTKQHNQDQAKSTRPQMGKFCTIMFDPLPKYGYGTTTEQVLFYDSLYGADKKLHSWIHRSNDASGYFDDMCRTTPCQSNKSQVSMYLQSLMSHIRPYSKALRIC